jgi:hypothetical protein
VSGAWCPPFLELSPDVATTLTVVVACAATFEHDRPEKQSLSSGLRRAAPEEEEEEEGPAAVVVVAAAEVVEVEVVAPVVAADPS